MSKAEKKKSSDSSPTKTLKRGLKVLEEVCRQVDGITQSEVARRLDVDRSTALRFLSTLEAEGYVKRFKDLSYQPTLKIAEMAKNLINSLEIKTSAREQLELLTAQTGFSSHLAVLSDLRIVYIDGDQAPGMVKVNADIGTTAPIHCSATGKALAAYLESGELEMVLAGYLQGADHFTVYTERTISDPARLKKGLSLIRTKGYALDNEEYEPGVRCLAAPIFDLNNQIAGVIGVSGTTVRLSASIFPELAVPVCAAADNISRAVGCSAPLRCRRVEENNTEEVT